MCKLGYFFKNLEVKFKISLYMEYPWLDRTHKEIKTMLMFYLKADFFHNFFFFKNH